MLGSAPEPAGGFRTDCHLLPNLLHFGRFLRRLGFALSPGRIRDLAETLALVGVAGREDVKNSARSILVGRQEQIPLFDRAFDLFFAPRGSSREGNDSLLTAIKKADRRKKIQRLGTVEGSNPPNPENSEPWIEHRQSYSSRESLRHKDFANLSDGELAIMRRLIRQGGLILPPRPTRRKTPGRRGHSLDPRRTLRRALAHGGEPLDLAWRRRKSKPRPLVALADISGSMEPYARILLELLYLLGGTSERVESFVFGTRLTRLTRSLEHRDVNEALRKASATVLDWGGGTRIGESLKSFNFTWARRVLGQGAVVLVISDGWDRGDPDLLEREVARLARSCDQLIWLNPLLGSPGYQPLTRGIRAILPHTDYFLPVHNLKSLEELGEILARLSRSRESRHGRGR